jgi:electron transport complex protein RnfG
MKEILNITFRLTVSCLLAAVVMGSTFIITNKAKKHNEHVREQNVMYSLLGYSEATPPPESVAMHEIYRYVVAEAGQQFIGYLVPGAHGGAAPFIFVALDLDGKLAWQKPVETEEDKVLEAESRNAAIVAAIGPGKDITFAEQATIVTDDGTRIAYLMSGKFPGFKTFIHAMLALDPKYSMLGFEVLEHEEDPGLGAEIEQDYFKNQFDGKTFDILKSLKVIKEPLPAEYQKALEGKVAEADIEKMMEQYREQDIYALTGATISTKAVTVGLQGIAKKFAYRLDTLDSVLKEQQIAVSFSN